ncbi:hypothetical protein LA080_006784 [Diaporthe eres]|nr:hypothetical protein LA080_006784 [Diaporthe eres]
MLTLQCHTNHLWLFRGNDTYLLQIPKQEVHDMSEQSASDSKTKTFGSLTAHAVVLQDIEPFMTLLIVQQPMISAYQITMPSDTTPLEGQSLIETSTISVEDSDHQVRGSDEEHGGSSRSARSSSLSVSWWLEGLAIVVSLLRLAAIVGLLYHFDGKEQPDWSYWINLNTVVATLSTILSPVAPAISQYKWYWFHHHPRRLIDIVRFDEASRGLMGSLKLLLRPRKSALVFVLSAVVGPFTQQTIRTFGCDLLYHNALASVPVAEYLDYRMDIDTYNSGDPFIVSPQMSIAVLEGLVGSMDQVNQISASCPTGNCDFFSADGAPTSYSSLAMCSSCEDITDHIIETHTVHGEHSGSWSYNISDTDPTYLAIGDGRWR